MSDQPTQDTNGGISRRTLAAGAAWAAPAVAVAAAAPAYALSVPDIPCEVIQTYDNLPLGQCVSNITFPPSAVTATITYSASYGNDDTPGDTCRVEQTNPGPPRQPWRYVELEMLQNLTQGRYITVTITLSQPMENLRFQLHDIDSTWNGWQDTVQINTPGYTVALGSGLQGTGSGTNRIRPTGWGDYPISSGLGDAVVTWAGPIQQVSFSYVAGINGNSGNQHIGLGNISFSDCIVPGQGNVKRAAAVSTGDTSARMLAPTVPAEVSKSTVSKAAATSETGETSGSGVDVVDH